MYNDLTYEVLKYLESPNIITILKKTNFPTKKYFVDLQINKNDDMSNIKYLIKYIRDVQTITLNDNICVTDNLIKKLKNIKNISLIKCSSITNRCIKYLKTKRFIRIDSCKRITDLGVEILRKIKDIVLLYIIPDIDLYIPLTFWFNRN